MALFENLLQASSFGSHEGGNIPLSQEVVYKGLFSRKKSSLREVNRYTHLCIKLLLEEKAKIGKYVSENGVVNSLRTYIYPSLD